MRREEYAVERPTISQVMVRREKNAAEQPPTKLPPRTAQAVPREDTSSTTRQLMAETQTPGMEALVENPTDIKVSPRRRHGEAQLTHDRNRAYLGSAPHSKPRRGPMMMISTHI